MPAKKKPTFEQSMLRIEEIVKKLEGGELPLEDALALFEEGAGLIKSCEKQLDEAEQKIVSLREGPDGSPEETPFDTAEET